MPETVIAVGVGTASFIGEGTSGVAAGADMGGDSQMMSGELERATADIVLVGAVGVELLIADGSGDGSQKSTRKSASAPPHQPLL